MKELWIPFTIFYRYRRCYLFFFYTIHYVANIFKLWFWLIRIFLGHANFVRFTVRLVNATIIKLKIKAVKEKINAHNVRCIMSTIKLCIACWHWTYIISKSWNILFYSLLGITSWFYQFCKLHLMIHNKTVINLQIQKDILFYYR